MSKHNLHHPQPVFVFVSHVPCKTSSVLCVIVHVSTQSVVSLSARESLQGAQEFTQTLELSVGGIGNCKDKSLRQLKPGFLFTRAFGISQISQIYSWRSPAPIRSLNPAATSWGSEPQTEICTFSLIGCRFGRVMPPFQTHFKHYVTDPCFILRPGQSLSLSLFLFLIPPVQPFNVTPDLPMTSAPLMVQVWVRRQMNFWGRLLVSLKSLTLISSTWPPSPTITPSPPFLTLRARASSVASLTFDQFNVWLFFCLFFFILKSQDMQPLMNKHVLVCTTALIILQKKKKTAPKKIQRTL